MHTFEEKFSFRREDIDTIWFYQRPKITQRIDFFTVTIRVHVSLCLLLVIDKAVKEPSYNHAAMDRSKKE